MDQGTKAATLPRIQTLPTIHEIPLYDPMSLDVDLKTVLRHGEAERITGGLSFTTKMPCPSWGISATRCKIGSVLAKQEGTTCHDCYALKGNYRRWSVQAKLEARYQGLFHPLWTPAMIFLVHYYCEQYFRWFDTGDLQGENHLRNIVTVALETPQVSHWLPTREIETVRAVKDVPENLVVRVSTNKVGGKPPKGFAYTSSVVTENASCPAPENHGACGDCRDCWEEAHVSYKLH